MIFLVCETNAISLTLAIVIVVLLAANDGNLWYYLADSAITLVRGCGASSQQVLTIDRQRLNAAGIRSVIDC